MGPFFLPKDMDRRKWYTQSVLIPRSRYTLAQAKQWLVDRGYKINFPGKSGPDITELYYRFLQAEPKHGMYRTLRLGKSEIMLIQHYDRLMRFDTFFDAPRCLIRKLGLICINNGL